MNNVRSQDPDSEIGPADSEEDRNISFSRSGESRGNAIAVKFGVRLVEVKMVKKATKNGVPPNLGDSWPPGARYNTASETASESAGESLKDRKENSS